MEPSPQSEEQGPSDRLTPRLVCSHLSARFLIIANMFDPLSFDLPNKLGRVGSLSTCRMSRFSRAAVTDVPRCDLSVQAGKNHRALQYVHQLADVPGPQMFLQAPERVFTQTFARPRVRQLVEKVLRQRGYVLHP